MRFNWFLNMSILFTFILWAQTGLGQIKPGKEGLDFSLDPAYKWKSKTVKSEFNAIRKTTFHVTGKNSASYPIQQVELTTIDKRYYTILSKSAVMEKIHFYQGECVDAILDLKQQGKTEKGQYVVYVIAADSTAACMDHVFVGLVVDGETAFHGIEIKIPTALATPELINQWTTLLSDFKIK
jgi:hypothetical protein